MSIDSPAVRRPEAETSELVDAIHHQLDTARVSPRSVVAVREKVLGRRDPDGVLRATSEDARKAADAYAASFGENGPYNGRYIRPDSDLV